MSAYGWLLEQSYTIEMYMRNLLPKMVILYQILAEASSDHFTSNVRCKVRLACMEAMPVEGLTLYFDADEREAAELVRQACEKSVRLIRECWGLNTPTDLRVYVLTSTWLRSTFHSAPWGWRILMGLTLPFWYFRARQLWQVAGGWQQQYGHRRMVGIKTPRLLSQGDSSMGDRIFIRENNADIKTQQSTCHELVHAFTAHLRLPAWLNEGLAMLTVDRFAEKPTIKRETIEALHHSPGNTNGARKLNLRDPDAAVYLYVRGYWLTRYIEETRPGLLKSLLNRRYSHNELENKIVAAYGMERQRFWGEIDGTVAAHFELAES